MLFATRLNQFTVGNGFAMLGVGNDAGPCIHVHRRNALCMECLGNQSAGESLSKTDHQVVGAGSQFADGGKSAQDLVNRLEFLLDPVLYRSLAVLRDQQGRGVAMTITQPRADGPTATAISATRRT